MTTTLLLRIASVCEDCKKTFQPRRYKRLDRHLHGLKSWAMYQYVVHRVSLQRLEAMLEEDVARLVGPRGRHNPDRAAIRHGSEPGQVTLGGRRVRVRRPRVRSADGTREVAVPTYQAFASTELLDQLTLERMLAWVPTGSSPWW